MFLFILFILFQVDNYVTSLDRGKSGLLIDVLNISVPPLVAEISPF